jgi:hypothetical protein
MAAEHGITGDGTYIGDNLISSSVLMFISTKEWKDATSSCGRPHRSRTRTMDAIRAGPEIFSALITLFFVIKVELEITGEGPLHRRCRTRRLCQRDVVRKETEACGCLADSDHPLYGRWYWIRYGHLSSVQDS